MPKRFELWAETREELSESIAACLTNGTFEELDQLSELILKSLRELAEGRWPSLHEDRVQISGRVVIYNNAFSGNGVIPRQVGIRVVVENKIVVW